MRMNVLVVNVLLEQIRDPQTSYALRDEILSLMNAGEIQHVVIDLKSVTFLGSPPSTGATCTCPCMVKANQRLSGDN